MTPLDPILFRELPVIRKIIDDEMWLEGERRGAAVSRHDPVVRENVCAVILRIGARLRESLMQESAMSLTMSADGAPTVAIRSEHHEAA